MFIEGPDCGRNLSYVFCLLGGDLLSLLLGGDDLLSLLLGSLLRHLVDEEVLLELLLVCISHERSGIDRRTAKLSKRLETRWKGIFFICKFFLLHK